MGGTEVFQPTLLKQDLELIVEVCEKEFSQLRGARIFITGGTGFFGKWMLESLFYADSRLSLGLDCTVLTRNPKRFLTEVPWSTVHPRLRLLQGGVQDFLFPEGEFTHLIHMASPTLQTARADAEGFIPLFQEFYEGSLRVLEFARKAKVRKFLEVSSGAVYGKPPTTMERIPETYEGAPDVCDFRSGLGEGKRVSEYLALTYGKAFCMDVVVARCFAFFGPYLPFEVYAAGNFIKNVLENQAIVIQGDGKPVRSYLYAADLTIWLWTLLMRGQSGQIYHVGSEQAISLGDLAREIVRVDGGHLPVQVLGASSSSQQRNHYVPCTKKARETLGLSQRIGLEEAIQRTLLFHRAKVEKNGVGRG